MGNFFGLTFFERRDVSLRMNGTEPLLLPSCAFSLSRWLIIKELNGGPVVQWRKVHERVKREGCILGNNHNGCYKVGKMGS